MTKFSAKSQAFSPEARQVVFVVFPGLALLDLAGPLQTFAWVQDPTTCLLSYRVALVAEQAMRVETDSYMSIDAEPLAMWIDRDIDTLIVVGGDGVYDAVGSKEFVSGVAKLAARSRRVCSVCSGAYLLAHAGLLVGRRAATHWEDADRLEADFPDVSVERDPIYVRDGHIWTSAGVTSGLDMSFALVAEDYGHAAALMRAQSLVAYMVRPGGQSQFSPVLERQKRDALGRFDALHAWIASNLRSDLGIDALARRENMSVRSFHRIYSATMGITPAKAVASIRIEQARDMLETSTARIKTVADRCGFKSEDHMRRSFIRTLGVSPAEYRDRFRL